MGRWRSHFGRAVSAHRVAAGALETAEQLVALRRPKDPEAELSRQARRRLTETIRAAAEEAAPGWLGLAPDRLQADARTGVQAVEPAAVRIGTVEAGGLPDPVPALLPTLGAGHIATDQDAREPGAAAVARTALLRLVAAHPAGTVRIVVVDAATAGAWFAAFGPLSETGIMEPPATTAAGLSGAFDAADRHMRAAQQAAAPVPHLLIVLTGLSGLTSAADWSRLAAIAHAGPASRTHLVLTGVPTEDSGRVPRLDHTTLLRIDSGLATVVGTGQGNAWLPKGTCIRLDPDPPGELITAVCRRQADTMQATNAVGISALIPEQTWQEDATHELRTLIGRNGPSDVDIAFGDSTPHCLIGGRTGSGKTVFLLDLLYGLAARYSPDELMLYLLDFKEGVSFSEFTPGARDQTWLPHVRSVGVESDRHYGVAVLAELQAEMLRRSAEMKRFGATRFAELRRANPDLPMPRIMAVIDEFQVLFAGNDRLARQAVAMLEDIARKGRSYGIHLVLASQTSRGIEALYAKSDSIFGQFALRIALAGATGVLDPMNTAAAGIRIGSAIVNREGGVLDGNERISFPNAHASPEVLAELRHRLWRARHPLNEPPAVFRGFAEPRVQDDPAFALLRPGDEPPSLLVGRAIDVAQSTAGFTFDAGPGRHLAVIGPDGSGADVLYAAALTLAHQQRPGTADFLVASLAAGADPVAATLMRDLVELGHRPVRIESGRLLQVVSEATGQGPAHLILFGVDAAAGLLEHKAPTGRSGQAELRQVLRAGPAAGVHVLGWWRGSRRFSEDIGGSSGREDVACLVVLNVTAQELSTNLGLPLSDYEWRPNRALLVDRHDGRNQLIVPFRRGEGSRV